MAQELADVVHPHGRGRLRSLDELFYLAGHSMAVGWSWSIRHAVVDLGQARSYGGGTQQRQAPKLTQVLTLLGRTAVVVYGM